MDVRYHLSKLLQAVWTLAMGAFLGLTGGLVVAVILAFKGARELAAAPGVAPYTDPRFADHGTDVVAGFIGQKLFAVGGVVALALLGLAVAARLANGLIYLLRMHFPQTGSRAVSVLRVFALAATVGLMGLATQTTLTINDRWPGLYDTAASDDEIAARRAEFARLHERSERVVTIAWLCGLVALGASPWCRQQADAASSVLTDPDPAL